MEKGMREGERLIEFCKERSLIIGNTWFENPKRRLYTWKSPGNRYRKQIDYILIEERFKNGMKRVCTLPGVDIDSDHNLLMAEVNFRMKKVHKGNRRKKWNLEKLKGKSQVVGEKIAERIKTEGVTSIEEQWKNIREGIKEVVKEEIGFEEGRIAQKPWVTREMLEKMDERRKFKSRTDEEGKKRYRKLNNELRRETEKEVENRWKEYIEDLYNSHENKNREMIEQEWEVREDEIEPEILKEEVILAMKEMKNGKEVGTDEIPIEVLKCLDDRGIQEIVKLCNRIYTTGEWPKDFVRTVMIPIPKKNREQGSAKNIGQ